jgi:isopentenyl phosphate kinase
VHPVREMARELETLAAVVHGGLAFGHALGLIFNIRRKNRVDAAIHGAALVYDVYACIKHARRRG